MIYGKLCIAYSETCGLLAADLLIDRYWHEWCEDRWCRDEPLKISQIAIAELIRAIQYKVSDVS